MVKSDAPKVGADTGPLQISVGAQMDVAAEHPGTNEREVNGSVHRERRWTGRACAAMRLTGGSGACPSSKSESPKFERSPQSEKGDKWPSGSGFSARAQDRFLHRPCLSH